MIAAVTPSAWSSRPSVRRIANAITTQAKPTAMYFIPVASGVLITTVTDVIGFFAFLGLASIWLL